MQWVRHARAAISRIDGAQEYEAMLATAEATTLIAAGERDAALPKLEQARAILEEEVGEDDPSTINVINSIGVVYQEQGRFDEALANHRRARDAWEASLGPNHPHVASAEQSIANTLALMGRHTEAIEGYRRVLDAWSATLPPSHPDVAMTHYNIGRLHQLDGRNEEALEEYLLAIELLEPTLGPDHTNTGMPIHNVGALYHEMGDLDAAQRYLEHSLAIFESNGVDPLYVAVNRFELAKVLHERDRDPNRVAQLIVAARDVLAGAGAFGAREHEALVEWVAKNRPDLVAAP
jgi:tetratricopeptide (TPR) repeat protein